MNYQSLVVLPNINLFLLVICFTLSSHVQQFIMCFYSNKPLSKWSKYNNLKCGLYQPSLTFTGGAYLQ